MATDWIEPWLERAAQMTALHGSEQLAGYHQLQQTMCHTLRLRQDYACQQRRLLTEQIEPLYNKLFPDCPLRAIQGIAQQSAATYRAFAPASPVTACPLEQAVSDLLDNE